MSHVAADGHNYYRIYNMIAGTAPVEAMTAERISEYEIRESEWTGKADFDWISGGAGLIKGMLGGLLFGPKSKWCCYYVDEAKVAAVKTTAPGKGGVAYVSTNDVLTSHFCNAASARVCMMVMNMRHKLPTLPISDSHAGCYEGCLILDRANYAEPAAIRRCLLAGVPYTRQTDSEPLPGLCGSCPMAFITSWASFDFDLNVDGVTKQVLHMPCMDMPDMMDVALVFRPTPGKLAMLYLAKRAKPHLLTGKDTILGDSVNDTMFPQK